MKNDDELESRMMVVVGVSARTISGTASSDAPDLRQVIHADLA
jgi:hypothetical protein